MSDDKQLTGKKRSRAEAAATPAAASDDEGTDSKKLAVQGPTSPIAVPMAGKKLHKKVYKVVTKAAKAKSLRRGVKEVVKAIRKGQSGCVCTIGHGHDLLLIVGLPCVGHVAEGCCLRIRSPSDFHGGARSESIVLSAGCACWPVTFRRLM